MNHLNPHKLGVAFGGTVAVVHVVWAVVVALGWGQAIVDFKLWAHMVSAPVTVGPFDLAAAVTVIVVSGLVGYVIGSVFGRVFNHAHR